MTIPTRFPLTGLRPAVFQGTLGPAFGVRKRKIQSSQHHENQPHRNPGLLANSLRDPELATLLAGLSISRPMSPSSRALDEGFTPPQKKVYDTLLEQPALADFPPKALQENASIEDVLVVLNRLYRHGIAVPKNVEDLTQPWILLPLARPFGEQAQGLLSKSLPSLLPEEILSVYLTYMLSQGFAYPNMGLPPVESYFTHQPKAPIPGLKPRVYPDTHTSTQQSFTHLKDAKVFGSPIASVNMAYQCLPDIASGQAFNADIMRKLVSACVTQTDSAEILPPQAQEKLITPLLRLVLESSPEKVWKGYQDIANRMDTQPQKYAAKSLLACLRTLVYGILLPQGYLDLKTKRFTPKVDALNAGLAKVRVYMDPKSKCSLGVHLEPNEAENAWQLRYQLQYQGPDGVPHEIDIPECGAATGDIPPGFLELAGFSFSEQVLRHYGDSTTRAKLAMGHTVGQFAVAPEISAADLPAYMAYWEQRGIEILSPPGLTKAHQTPIVIRKTEKTKLRGSGLALLNHTQPLKNLEVVIAGKPYTLKEAAKLLKTGLQEIALVNGQWQRLDKEAFSAIAEMVKAQKGSLTLHDLMYLASVYRVDLQIEPAFDALFKGIQHGTAMAMLPFPQGFKGKQLDYQQYGFSWIDHMTRLGLGVILADEMGLGKTTQAIQMLQHRKNRGELQHPVMVVAPAGVLENWRQEIQERSDGFTVIDASTFYDTVEGVPKLRKASKAKGKRVKKSLLEQQKTIGLAALTKQLAQPNQIVLVSYETLLKRKADFEQIAKTVGWAGMILDEAHEIRTDEALQTQACKELAIIEKVDSQSHPKAPPFRVALTGTPVCNSEADLRSLMGFVTPGYLPHFDSGWTLEKLNAYAAPFILRRVRTDTGLDKLIPTRHPTREHLLVLSPIQETLLSLINRYAAKLKVGALEVDNWRRLVCNHPGLLLHQNALLKEAGLEPNQDLNALMDSVLKDPGLVDLQALHLPSPKITTLIAQLRQIPAGEKALIFTDSVPTGLLIQRYLQAELATHHPELADKKVTVPYMHGTVSPPERTKMLADFQTNPDSAPWMVLKYDVGGVGLNIPRANHVFLFDPIWNPAKSDQAIMRIDRIGQAREMHVTAFKMLDSIETVRIEARVTEKRKVANELLEGTGEERSTIPGVLRSVPRRKK